MLAPVTGTHYDAFGLAKSELKRVADISRVTKEVQGMRTELGDTVGMCVTPLPRFKHPFNVPHQIQLY